MILVEEHIGEISSALYATFAGLVVGAIIKGVNKILDRKKDNLEEHLVLRKELREELDAVKAELHELQKEIDEWKTKYYSQVNLTNQLKVQIMKLTEDLDVHKRITGNYPIIQEDQ